jgi:hypothetical protein
MLGRARGLYEARSVRITGCFIVFALMSYFFCIFASTFHKVVHAVVSAFGLNCAQHLCAWSSGLIYRMPAPPRHVIIRSWMLRAPVKRSVVRIVKHKCIALLENVLSDESGQTKLQSSHRAVTQKAVINLYLRLSDSWTNIISTIATVKAGHQELNECYTGMYSKRGF